MADDSDSKAEGTPGFSEQEIENLYEDALPKYVKKAITKGDNPEMIVRSVAPILTHLAAKRQAQTLEGMKEQSVMQARILDAMRAQSEQQAQALKGMAAHSDAMVRQAKWMLGLTVALFVAVVIQVAIACSQLSKM